MLYKFLKKYAKKKVKKVVLLSREEQAFQLLQDITQDFKMGKINSTPEGDIFVILDRVQEGKCLIVDKDHHTCPSYLLIKKNNEVYVGCYAKCKTNTNSKLRYLGTTVPSST